MISGLRKWADALARADRDQPFIATRYENIDGHLVIVSVTILEEV